MTEFGEGLCFPTSQNRDVGHPLSWLGEAAKGKGKSKSNRRSFDSRAARSAARIAQDDS
jgi:hypothetical protein